MLPAESNDTSETTCFTLPMPDSAQPIQENTNEEPTDSQKLDAIFHNVVWLSNQVHWLNSQVYMFLQIMENMPGIPGKILRSQFNGGKEQ